MLKLTEKTYPSVIATSGFAKTGKDTFCQLLIERFKLQGITAKRLALADALKNDINPFFKEKCGIDIFNCKPEEKELLRGLMVEFGRLKRRTSKGMFWTSKLDSQIRENTKNRIITILTDLRYDEYSTDERDWLQTEHKGILVYIKTYELVPNMVARYGGFPVQEGFEKQYIEAPNQDEAINCPKLEKAADFIIDWPLVKNLPILEAREILFPYVENFVKELDAKFNS